MESDSGQRRKKKAMKLMIVWIRNETCRSWTNADPEEHTCMALAVWCDAMKRLGEKWGKTPREAAERVNNMFDEN